MDTLEAIRIIEGDENATEEELAAWQYLVDTGIVWQLQGFYGRGATRLIEQGLISPRPTEQGPDDRHHAEKLP